MHEDYALKIAECNPNIQNMTLDIKLSKFENNVYILVS
jgi:hypothetical protein